MESARLSKGVQFKSGPALKSIFLYQHMAKVDQYNVVMSNNLIKEGDFVVFDINGERQSLITAKPKT